MMLVFSIRILHMAGPNNQNINNDNGFETSSITRSFVPIFPGQRYNKDYLHWLEKSEPYRTLIAGILSNLDVASQREMLKESDPSQLLQYAPVVSDLSYTFKDIRFPKDGFVQIEFDSRFNHDGIRLKDRLRWHTRTSHGPGWQGPCWVLEREVLRSRSDESVFIFISTRGLSAKEINRYKELGLIFDENGMAWCRKDIWIKWINRCKNPETKSVELLELLDRGHHPFFFFNIGLVSLTSRRAALNAESSCTLYSSDLQDQFIKYAPNAVPLSVPLTKNMYAAYLLRLTCIPTLSFQNALEALNELLLKFPHLASIIAYDHLDLRELSDTEMSSNYMQFTHWCINALQNASPLLALKKFHEILCCADIERGRFFIDFYKLYPDEDPEDLAFDQTEMTHNALVQHDGIINALLSGITGLNPSIAAIHANRLGIYIQNLGALPDIELTPTSNQLYPNSIDSAVRKIGGLPAALYCDVAYQAIYHGMNKMRRLIEIAREAAPECGYTISEFLSPILINQLNFKSRKTKAWELLQFLDRESFDSIIKRKP